MPIPSAPSSMLMLEGVNWCVVKLSKVSLNDKFFKDLAKIATEFRKNPELYTSLGKRVKEVGELKDVTAKVLEKVPGGGSAATKASKLSGLLGVLFAAGVITAILKLQEFQQETQDKFNNIIGGDLSKTLSLIQTIKSRLDNTNAKVKEFELQDQRSRDRVYALEKEIVPVRENSNNALYEVRVGRKILEGKISESDQRAETARKLANDALYEARAGKQTIDTKIQEARKLGNDALYETRQNNTKNGNSIDNLFRQYNDLVSKVNQNLGKSIDATINAIKADIKVSKDKATKAQETANKAETKNTAQDKEIDAAVATVRGLARALEAVPKIVNPTAAVSPADIAELRNGLGNIKVDLSSLRQANQYQLDALSNQDRALAGSISGLASTDKELAAAIDKVDKKAIVPDLTPIQKALNDKFDAFVQQNNKDLGIRDLKVKDLTKSELSKEFDRIIANFERQSNLTSDQRFQEFQRQNAIDLGVKTNQLQQTDTSLKTDINTVKEDLRKIGADITGLNTKIKEREDVDTKVNEKLDKMIPLLQTIPLMPARIADTIKPSIPTLPEINNEVGKAICNNFTSGCGKKSLDQQSADINNANKANSNDLLNKLNAGANAGQLAALEVINNKLGAQIEGGIAGKLVNGFKWLQLDRLLNVLIFIATVHNGFQLSSAIVETLGTAVNNGLSVIGIKDDKDQPISISNLIGSSVNSVIVSIVGAENATQISNQWAKANRIYQASSNVLNNLMNVNSVITNGLEVIGSYTGKIGNALRGWGVVGEKAFAWMNPQPSFDNKWIAKLEQLQQGASTVQMITQVPVDTIQAVTEFNNSATEFVKAVQQDGETVKKGVDVGEAKEVKAKQDAIKLVSKSPEISVNDLEADA